MTLPENLEIEVTRRHLAEGSRKDIRESPLAMALRQALPGAGLTITDHDVTVYMSHPVGHDARYFIPDDAWKLVARHAAGRKVKPGRFTLPAIYRRR